MKTRFDFSQILFGLFLLTLPITWTAAAELVLLGLWRFNKADGDTAKDSSAFSHDGTMTGENGNLPARVAGQTGFGGALRFTNNGVDHAYVNAPASPDLKIGMTADDTWTLAIWAYESTDGTGDYIATYGRFLSQDDGNGIQWDSGAVGDSQVYLWHGTLWQLWGTGFGTDTPVAPLFDQWTHRTLVYDGQNLTLFRNGNQGPLGGKLAFPLRGSLNWPGYSGAIQIGSQLNMSAREWHGMLDDVAVFKGALSETEIRLIMSGDYSPYLGQVAQIGVQPQDQTANPGWDVTLSVAAGSPSPLGYQWQFHGENVVGATGATLTLTNIQSSQAGPYRVVITNAAGTVTSILYHL